MDRNKFFHIATISSLLALIALGIAWETVLAPLAPGRYWMALKVVPLLVPLAGVIKRDVYTLQWASMLILIYFAEGIVRATSDRNAVSAWLAWGEVALTCLFFFCSLLYLRPYKKAAKKLTQQVIDKVSK